MFWSLWQLKFKGGNKGIGVTIRGIKYQLQQLHWHSPSEHTINGKRYLCSYIYILPYLKNYNLKIYYLIGEQSICIKYIYRYVLEEHLVHESEDKRYAVVAFLYKLGAADPFLLSVLQSQPSH